MIHASPPRPRPIGAVNWLGLWTLYVKEVRRFAKVWTQTLLAPVATTLIFLAIFTFAIGGAGRGSADVPFTLFLAPGLIVMAMTQNAFANTSSSLMIAKIQGNIVDVLMPPISAAELVAAYALGGLTRGLCVAAAVAVPIELLVGLPFPHPLLALFYAAAGSLALALAGLLAGLWAEKFDQMSVITNFIVTPLTFLSGTFYTIERLPDPFHMVAQLNPVFYMIDGFRYASIGHADGVPWVGALVLVVLDLALLASAHHLVRIGYKLKA